MTTIIVVTVDDCYISIRVARKQCEFSQCSQNSLSEWKHIVYSKQSKHKIYIVHVSVVLKFFLLWSIFSGPQWNRICKHHLSNHRSYSNTHIIEDSSKSKNSPVLLILIQSH